MDVSYPKPFSTKVSKNVEMRQSSTSSHFLVYSVNRHVQKNLMLGIE